MHPLLRKNSILYFSNFCYNILRGIVANPIKESTIMPKRKIRWLSSLLNPINDFMFKNIVLKFQGLWNCFPKMMLII